MAKRKKILIPRRITVDVCGVAYFGLVTTAEKVEVVDGDVDAVDRVVKVKEALKAAEDARKARKAEADKAEAAAERAKWENAALNKAVDGAREQSYGAQAVRATTAASSARARKAAVDAEAARNARQRELSDAIAAANAAKRAGTIKAAEADLDDPDVLCINVGGAGQVAERNFDRAAGSSATRQGLNFNLDQGIEIAKPAIRLADYIDHPYAPDKKSLFSSGVTLGDLFLGMLTVKGYPEEQLHGGVAIFWEIVGRNINPAGWMPLGAVFVWQEYARAAKEAAKVQAAADWEETSSYHRRVAWLETEFAAAPAALFAAGADIAVVLNPRFGPDKKPRFVVAGNGIDVRPALPDLNHQEWSGRVWAATDAAGTTVASPRQGSSMTLSEVVGIVRSTL